MLSPEEGAVCVADPEICIGILVGVGIGVIISLTHPAPPATLPQSYLAKGKDGHSLHPKGATKNVSDAVKAVSKKLGIDIDVHDFSDWLHDYKDYNHIPNDAQEPFKWMVDRVKEYLDEIGVEGTGL